MFTDRREAGRRLAEALVSFRGPDVVILGLPRGGVPVAEVVARELEAPLDVLVVRKLGVPSQPELAMGAIGEGGVRVLNESVLRARRLSDEDVDRVEVQEREALRHRVHALRGGHAPIPLQGRTAIVVDDGIATGASARAACLVARHLGAARVVIAIPVASPGAVALLEQVADQVVCLETPEWFSAVGQCYGDFHQVADGEVVDLLRTSRRNRAGSAGSSARPATEEELER
jgi:putative phosphoribosyl transferase